MQEFGHFSLCLAWLLAIAGMCAGIYAGLRQSSRWFHSAIHATVLGTAATSMAVFALGYAFVTNDYSNQYVWQYSSRDLSWYYKVSAIWGGMDGSMLLWCCILSLSAAALAAHGRAHRTAMMAWVLAVINSSSLFFLTVTLFLTNPFRYLRAPFIPPDGNGLNPLLQNEYMAVHPPSLYIGFTMLAVPYAFCMGALLAGDLSHEWIRRARRWTLAAWGFLTLGIVLGGFWAYIELGWGGFWAWDPVENASLLPWLTATAFVHSVMAQERTDMFKAWNVWLIVTTYALTVFGTFLTRSGVVQSVHAFASTNIGWIFLLYIAIIFALAAALTIFRRRGLKTERSIASFFSREAFFLVNNLLLLSIAIAVIWGVLFPLLSAPLTGSRQTVGASFFNAATMPLFLGVLFLMGAGPLVAWQKTSLKNLQRSFFAPLLSALVITALLLWAEVHSYYAILCYALCSFAAAAIAGEIRRGLSAQRAVNGAHVVHFGVVVAAIGITSAMVFKAEKEFTLAQGERFRIGRFELKLESVFERSGANYDALAARVALTPAAGGAQLTALAPELRRYRRNDEPTSEVALFSSAREDVYLVFAGIDDQSRRASFKVVINPLQVWLWIGAAIMLLGTIVVLVPRRGRQTE